ncbi:YggS family pyridoxal phosphate-dependent enzyme, partial [Alcaligenes pakistanensis]
LMTLALMDADPERVRPCFVLLRNLRDQLRNDIAHAENIRELSMGMSGDYEVAIAEGSTIVRVGQAIFGARATPNNFYWPVSDTATTS